jgi:hypothetical protein
MTADLRPQILRLARSGSPERAWTLFQQGGLESVADDSQILTLKARLLKDFGKRSQDRIAQRDWFRRSADVYLQAFALEARSYPLINAASLALLAEDRDRSVALAKQTLALLDHNPGEAETAYWREATRAEALVLLQQIADAQAALAKAVAQAPQAWEDHAATLGQFAKILAALGCDTNWLTPFRPPASVHFSGIMGIAIEQAALRAQIDNWLAEQNVGFGYGALAAGADIIIAEALLTRGGELHIILPCDITVFREQSVLAVDPAWGPRFDALLDAAHSIDCLQSADAPLHDAVMIADETAIGLCIHHARNLQSRHLALKIVGEGEPLRPGDPIGLLDRSAVTQLAAVRGARVSDAAGSVLPRCYLVAVPDASKAGVGAGCLPAASVLITVDGFTIGHFPGPAAALSWLAECALTGLPDMALDYGLIAGEVAQSTLIRRCIALARCVQPGQCLATEAAAFALLAHHPAINPEPMGEIRTAFERFAYLAIPALAATFGR